MTGNFDECPAKSKFFGFSMYQEGTGQLGDYLGIVVCDSQTYVLRVCLEIFMNYSEKPSCKVKIDDIIYIFSKENMTGILCSFLRKIWKIMQKIEEKENVVCQEVISRERYIC